jgi:hypothetical protein
MVAWGKVARLVWRYAKHKSDPGGGGTGGMVTMVCTVRTWLPAAAHTVFPLSTYAGSSLSLS